MFEAFFLIPLVGNDGISFRGEDFARFEAEAVALFGGVTRLPSSAIGQWVGEGVLFVDETIVYVVAVKSIALGDKIGTLAMFAKFHFRQEAIYVRYLGIAEYF